MSSSRDIRLSTSSISPGGSHQYSAGRDPQVDVPSASLAGDDCSDHSASQATAELTQSRKQNSQPEQVDQQSFQVTQGDVTAIEWPKLPSGRPSSPDPLGGHMPDLRFRSTSPIIAPTAGHALKMWDGAEKALRYMKARQEFAKVQARRYGDILEDDDDLLDEMMDLDKVVDYVELMRDRCIDDQFSGYAACACCGTADSHFKKRTST